MAGDDFQSRRTEGRPAVRSGEREKDTTLLQVFLDREGDPALETGRRENVAHMARIGEPSHDRAEALGHTRGWVADAVVIGQEKPHGSSV